jgi:hypothetical protein
MNKQATASGRGSHRAPREEYCERVPEMRDAAEEERAAFFLKHDTFWV